MKKISPYNKLEDDIYQKKSRNSIILVIFTIFIAFAFGLVLNFDLKKTVLTHLDNAILTNRACPMNFKKSDLTFFWFPNYQLQELTISKRCLQTQNHLVLKKLRVKILGPSFNPIGLKIELKAIDQVEDTKDRTNLNILAALSPLGHQIRVEKTTLKDNFLNQFLAPNFSIEGDFKLKALISGNLDFSIINKGQVLLESDNFKLPSQRVQIITLPEMNLKKLFVKANIKKMDLKPLEIVIGDPKAPIHAKADGEINLNRRNIAASKMNLLSKVKFSESILQKFSILKIFLGNKKDKDNYYKIQFSGNFNKPNPPKVL